MGVNGMYTDAQWAWLHDRRCEGHSIRELTLFARCSASNMEYHWMRLGLRLAKEDRRNLDRKAFEALGRREDG